MTREKTREDSTAGNPVRTLVAAAVGSTLAVGAFLGLFGLRTSGFALTLTAGQAPRILVGMLVLYLVVGMVALLLSTRTRRRRGTRRALEQPVLHLMTTVTLWLVLTVMFLPLKGAETFVRARTLSTLQLNVIGLAVVLIAGWVVGWGIARLVAALLSLIRERLGGRWLTVAGLAFAVAAVVVLAVGTRPARGSDGVLPAPSAGVPRVAVIGVDGCDWEKLGPLVEAGRVPNFERLMREGVYGPLESIPPLVSPRIWTSIATGKSAEKHGIHDFVNEAGVPVNAAMREASTVWEMVSAFGEPVGVVGWYVTWPVDEVNGFIISDRVHSLLRGPVQMVQSLGGRPTNDRLESFGGFEFDPGYKSYPETDLRYQQNRIVDEPLRWGYLRDAIYARLAQLLLPSYKPTFSAVYLRGVDFVQHFFWKYSDPEPFGDVTDAEIAAYGGVIDSYYVYTDVLLGRLLEALGDDVSIVIVADHGFQPRVDDPDPRRPQLTGTHDIEGVFMAAGPAFRSAGLTEGATILDITPTVLAAMGLPVADDMDGRVLTEILDPEHLTRHPVQTIPTYEQVVGRERGEIGSTMDDSIREQLRSLGYIE